MPCEGSLAAATDHRIAISGDSTDPESRSARGKNLAEASCLRAAHRSRRQRPRRPAPCSYASPSRTSTTCEGLTPTASPPSASLSHAKVPVVLRDASSSRRATSSAGPSTATHSPVVSRSRVLGTGGAYLPRRATGRLRSLCVPLTAIVIHVTRPGARADALLAAATRRLGRGTPAADERGHV